MGEILPSARKIKSGRQAKDVAAAAVAPVVIGQDPEAFGYLNPKIDGTGAAGFGVCHQRSRVSDLESAFYSD